MMNIVKEGMNKDFVPSEIHYRSWEGLTKLLDNVPSVDTFDLNKTCHLISDASLYGSGACIIQMDSLGNPSVCSWFSKKFTSDFSCLKSSVTREAIGLLFAIEHYEKWLRGARKV